MDAKEIRLEQAILTLTYLKDRRNRLAILLTHNAVSREEYEEADYKARLQELEVKLLRLE